MSWAFLCRWHWPQTSVSRPLVKERRLLTHLRELMPVGRLFHQRVAGDTSQPAVGVGTGFPIGLNAALMATETGFVLDSWLTRPSLCER